jgi:DNA-binding Lrp family transcriptional regulator
MQTISLDKKDRKILQLLDADSRMSLTKISRKTGIPIDTVRYRIERMEKEKIFKYAIVIDHHKLGYPIFNEIHLQFVNFTVAEEESVKKYLKNTPNMVYGAKVAGKYDYVIAIMAKDMKEFDDVFHAFKTKFEKIIKDYDIALIIEEYKLDYLIDLIGLTD